MLSTDPEIAVKSHARGNFELFGLLLCLLQESFYSSVELKDVTTFGDLCYALLRCVSFHTHKSTEVHLIL